MSDAPTGILYLQADVPFDRKIGKLQQQHEHDHVLLSWADLIVEPIGIAGPQLGLTNPGPRGQRTYRSPNPLDLSVAKREVIFQSATAWISFLWNKS